MGINKLEINETRPDRDKFNLILSFKYPLFLLVVKL